VRKKVMSGFCMSESKFFQEETAMSQKSIISSINIGSILLGILLIAIGIGIGIGITKLNSKLTLGSVVPSTNLSLADNLTASLTLTGNKLSSATLRVPVLRNVELGNRLTVNTLGSLALVDLVRPNLVLDTLGKHNLAVLRDVNLNLGGLHVAVQLSGLKSNVLPLTPSLSVDDLAV
jgi:hypothetical protein